MLKLGFKVYNIAVVLSLLSILLLAGCYKFEGNDTIPAYVSIDEINLTTYYPEQGTNSEDVDDVWVYVDDGLLGIYEFPAEGKPLIFPALVSGKHKLEIRPGIKLNGISSTRVPYPFYEPIIFEDYDFIPENEAIVEDPNNLGVLTTTYTPETQFVWIEDFEEADISLDNYGDTIIERTLPENNPIAFLSANSRFSGEINLTTERPSYTATSYNSFDVQTAGTVVVMEMNFKTENFLQVGLLIRDEYEVHEKSLVIMNHTDEWKKIYINLGSNLSLYPSALDYKVIFRAGLSSGNSEAKILIDNIKIVYR